MKRRYENKDIDYDVRGKRYCSKDMDKRLRRHLPVGFETKALTPLPANGDFQLNVDFAALPFFQFQQLLRQTALFRNLTLSNQFDFTTTAAEEELQRSPTAIIQSHLANTLFYTISYCAYLSSNCLLPGRKLDMIVEWIVVNAGCSTSIRSLKFSLRHFGDLHASAIKLCGTTWAYEPGKIPDQLLLFRGLQFGNIKLFHWRSLLEGAVENGKTALVKVLVDNQPSDIAISDSLLFDTLVRHENIAQVLVRVGMDIEVAAQDENWDLVKFLVEHGASIDPGYRWLGSSRCEVWVDEINDCFDVDDMIDVIPVVSALQAAVRSENMDMTQFLLTKGASVDARPQMMYGHTALHIAATIGNEHLVNLLLESGADVNADPGFFKGATTLQFATKLRDLKIYNIFARGHGKAGQRWKKRPSKCYNGWKYHIDVNEPPDACGGRTALQTAAESNSPNSLEIMRLLHLAGADSNGSPAEQEGKRLCRVLQPELYSEQYGSTALHNAIENRYTHMVAFLLQRGANPFSGPFARTGRTPLQGAFWNGDIRIVSPLINHSATFNKGVTALQAAIHSHNLELTKFLLGLGADANAPGASIRGHFKGQVYNLLRLENHGFCYTAGSTTVCEPKDIFHQNNENFTEFMELVAGSGLDIRIFPTAWVIDALAFAIHMKNYLVIDTILSIRVLPMGVEVDDSCIGLQLAVSIDDIKTAEIFIKHRADVNELCCGAYRRSTLSLAVYHNHVDLVKYLLENADIELVSNRRTWNLEEQLSTPLHVEFSNAQPVGSRGRPHRNREKPERTLLLQLPPTVEEPPLEVQQNVVE
ncbi:hypothetical protein ACJ73_08652 [Blastomyces percursus]|uniref:Uncharacterized protein n=1 Tax=Blastomyces percursus TaxID=1658174 RepID=A0A1J9QSU5_9EURO|nr:hypothetical protein ACJ73_08652 [Blastomyces percursus]